MADIFVADHYIFDKKSAQVDHNQNTFFA